MTASEASGLIRRAFDDARTAQEYEQQLITWYVDAFIADPARGYALMCPAGATNKYARRHRELTTELVGGAVLGILKPRRLPIAGAWQDVPISIAVTPEHRDGWARFGAVDVDAGGELAMRRGLEACRAVGLWAFAQLGESADHAGGHLVIPCAEPLPASLLRDLSVRMQAAAQIAGEVYPCNRDLRLPLMPHLRAPDGPRRFPLLLQDGTLIAVDDTLVLDAARDALAQLHAAWQPNSTETIMAALEQLPPVSLEHRQPLHKSKIRPQHSASVIHWFDDNYTVPDLLAAIGVRAAERSHVVRCPWHDDRSPSLAIWRDHATGQHRCKCLSRASNCPAADAPYLDAFNIYCLVEGLTSAAAVKRIADEHRLGQRRHFKLEQPPVEPMPALPGPTPLAAHQQTIADARARLADEMRAATERPGRVTVIKAIMGLGKTRTGALLARELHNDGQTVAIVAASRQLAEEEWRNSRLYDALVWQPRTEICTCYEPGYLAALAAKGYTLPDCTADCPYARQHAQRTGRIVIYQHAHLHLNDGELLEDADVVIVDESPLGALLEEHAISQEEIRLLGNRLARKADPALLLLRALYRVAHDYKPQQHSLRGAALRAQLDADLQRNGADLDLDGAIAAAKTSPVSARHVKADGVTPSDQLPPIFFGAILEALQLGTLAWDGRVWLWYERNRLLQACQHKTTSPAVLVLDGSADPVIANRLYDGWPVDLVTIDMPISPAVRVVQCPITPSTRKIVQDREQRDRLTRAIAGVCHNLGVVIDAGVSYLASTDHFAATLGGTWLHYGGQRGRNDLKDARTLAIIASPTAPPDAIERKAEALWAGEYMPDIDCTWERVGQGNYHARDPRLEAVNRLHGPEELRQAAHRCRPILCEEPTTLLICSPWDLQALGLTPAYGQIHQITELPYGNSAEALCAEQAYQAARSQPAETPAPTLAVQPPAEPSLQKNRAIQSGVANPPINLIRIVRGDFFANALSLTPPTMPPYQPEGNGDGRRSDWRQALDPATAPGVRMGTISSDDAWFAHQAMLREQEPSRARGAPGVPTETG